MSSKRQYFFILAVMIIPLVLIGCLAPPTAHVIRPLNKIERVKGDRPKVFIRYRPFSYADHSLYVKTPSGRAFIDLGGALAASYKEGLGGFFMVVHGMQYADYVAKINFDEIKGQVQYNVDDNGENVLVSVRLVHRIHIHYTFDNSVEEVVYVEAMANKVIPYGDNEHFARQTAILIQEMLPPLEADIAERLRHSDHDGKYVPR